MPIKIRCKSCQAEFTAPDALAGKRVRCKSCQAAVTVEAEPPDPFASLPDLAKLEQLDPMMLGGGLPPAAALPGGAAPVPAWQQSAAQPAWNQSHRPPRRRSSIQWRSSDGLSPPSIWLMVWGGTFLFFLLVGLLTMLPLMGLFIRVFSIVLYPLMFIGLFTAAGVGIWLLVMSYEEDELLFSLLIPFYLIYFMFKYWEKTRVAGHIYCAALLPTIALLGYWATTPLFVSIAVAGGANQMMNQIEAQKQRDEADRARTEADRQRAEAARQQIERARQQALDDARRARDRAQPASSSRAAPAPASNEVALGEGYVIKPPAGYQRTEGQLSTFLGTPTYRSRWELPDQPSLASLSVNIEKLSGAAAVRLPRHTTVNIAPNMSGTVVRFNGQYVLPDAEINETTIDGLTFLQARRLRSIDGTTQYILLLAGYSGDTMVEMICVSSEPFGSASANLLEAAAKSLHTNVASATFVPYEEPKPASTPQPDLAATPPANDKPLPASPNSPPTATPKPPPRQGAAGPKIACLAISSQGDRAAVGDAEGSVEIWELKGGRTLAKFKAYTAPFWRGCMAFSPDGSRLVTSGEPFTPTIDIWDAALGTAIVRLGKPREDAELLRWSADGKFIVAAGNGTVSIFRATGEEEQRLKTSGNIQSLDISNDARVVAVGTRDGMLVVWDRQSKVELINVKDNDSRTESVAVTGDGQLVASGTRGGLRLREVASGRETVQFAGQPRAEHLWISPDGKQLLSSDGRSVIVWNTTSGKSTQTAPMPNTQSSLDGLVFSADGQTALAFPTFGSGRDAVVVLKRK